MINYKILVLDRSDKHEIATTKAAWNSKYMIPCLKNKRLLKSQTFSNHYLWLYNFCFLYFFVKSVVIDKFSEVSPTMLELE
jgi:hypothetical protein